MEADLGVVIEYRGNRIGGVMVSVLASSAVDRGYEPQSDQTKDYKLGICCQAHIIKEKEQRLVGCESAYCVRVGMSLCRVLFQCSTMKIQLSVLV